MPIAELLVLLGTAEKDTIIRSIAMMWFNPAIGRVLLDVIWSLHRREGAANI